MQAAANTGDLPDVLETHTNGDDFTFGGAGLLEDLADDVPADWTANYRSDVAAEGTVTEQYYEDVAACRLQGPRASSRGSASACR